MGLGFSLVLMYLKTSNPFCPFSKMEQLSRVSILSQAAIIRSGCEWWLKRCFWYLPELIGAFGKENPVRLTQCQNWLHQNEAYWVNIIDEWQTIFDETIEKWERKIHRVHEIQVAGLHLLQEREQSNLIDSLLSRWRTLNALDRVSCRADRTRADAFRASCICGGKREQKFRVAI